MHNTSCRKGEGGSKTGTVRKNNVVHCTWWKQSTEVHGQSLLCMTLACSGLQLVQHFFRSDNNGYGAPSQGAEVIRAHYHGGLTGIDRLMNTDHDTMFVNPGFHGCATFFCLLNVGCCKAPATEQCQVALTNRVGMFVASHQLQDCCSCTSQGC